jgi:cell division protein FtsL
MTRRGSARSRTRTRGRVLVAFALVGFVVVASAVIWRRSIGIGQARELRDLSRHRAQLVAERAALLGAVRVAASRGRIQPIAEQRLGMRVPADTQVVSLVRPTVAPSAAP